MSQDDKKFFFRITQCQIQIIELFLDFQKNITFMKILTFAAALISIQATAEDFIVNNFGCKQFDKNGRCKECSSRYYMDKDKICQPVNQNCQTYNPQNGACTSCYDGFIVIEDTCLPQTIFTAYDFHCRKFQGNKCLQCSNGYFFNKEHKCTLANSSCKTFDSNNGNCLSCYPGYQLNNGQCIINTSSTNLITGCKQFKDGKCIKCSFGYYFDQNMQCKKIDDECQKFNIQKKKCQKCYQGYKLNQNGKCITQTTQALKDPFCAKWKDGICQKCAFGSFFNTAGVCVPVQDSCKVYDYNQNRCNECYPGYKLNEKFKCIKDDANNKINDAYCAIWKNGKCVQCSKGTYFNELNVCTVIDSNCKQFDENLKRCKDCYQGYKLDQKFNCVKAKTNQNGNALCKKWEFGQCVQCSAGAYFNNQGICSLADQFCQVFNYTTSICQKCYAGYKIDNGFCKLQTSEDVDLYCKKFANGTCIECSQRYYLNKQNKCQEVNKLCKTYDKSNGNCQSCYIGYRLETGKCVQDKQKINDPYCAKWQNGVCKQCSKGTFFNSNGKCEQIDALCKQFDKQKKTCVECYAAFKLQKGKCVPDVGFVSSDPNCAQFQHGFCLRCSKGFYFNEYNKCVQSDSQCAKFNSLTQKCQQCFTGYQLNAGLCVKAKANNLQDPNCAEFRQNVCVRCSKGFYFDSFKKCVKIDPYCAKFDELTQACRQCYQGYKLQNNYCIQQKQDQTNCAKWDKGICIQCVNRTWMTPQHQCKKVDNDCKTYDNSNGKCLSCYPAFELNQSTGKCLKQSLEAGCAKFTSNGLCEQCSKGYYLQNQKCQRIDELCANFDYQTLKCQQCYSGYTLVKGKCQKGQIKKEIKKCLKYDPDTFACIECFDRYFVDKEGQCSQVSFFCKKYNKSNGDCTDCYNGFTLQNGKCIKSQK